MVIFNSTNANIIENSKLYQAQIDAYQAVQNYYEQFPEFDKREVLVVMPTGSGKTGLMSILPFANCKGKVLLIIVAEVCMIYIRILDLNIKSEGILLPMLIKRIIKCVSCQ